MQAYLWDNNQVVVEWLEKHMSDEDGTPSAIRENIKYLKRENTLKHIRRYSFCCEEIAATMVCCMFTSKHLGPYSIY